MTSLHYLNFIYFTVFFFSLFFPLISSLTSFLRLFFICSFVRLCVLSFITHILLSFVVGVVAVYWKHMKHLHKFKISIKILYLESYDSGKFFFCFSNMYQCCLRLRNIEIYSTHAHHHHRNNNRKFN